MKLDTEDGTCQLDVVASSRRRELKQHLFEVRVLGRRVASSRRRELKRVDGECCDVFWVVASSRRRELKHAIAVSSANFGGRLLTEA